MYETGKQHQPCEFLVINSIHAAGDIIEINPKLKPITNNDKTKGILKKKKSSYSKKKMTTTINWNNPIYKRNLQFGN